MDSTFSRLVDSAEKGDRAAADKLFAALYDELHRMARRELAQRGSGVTLGATTLLHEAYLDISDRERTAFPDRNRFMGYASRVMRGLIIDFARRRQTQKRGGEFEITSMATDVADARTDADHLTRLSDALDELGAAEPRLARIVDLKFFCGFSFGETRAMPPHRGAAVGRRASAGARRPGSRASGSSGATARRPNRRCAASSPRVSGCFPPVTGGSRRRKASSAPR